MKTINLFDFLSVDIRKGKKTGKEFIEFNREYTEFLRKNNDNRFDISDNYPCLEDKNAFSGIASGQYFHQDLFVAQHIFKTNPQRHVDIGSRVDGFVAHVATFRTIEVFDVRTLVSKTDNIIFHQMDLTVENPDYSNYCDSLSCLHALEHFGLGRYGDKIDPDGHIKGFNNMSKILKKNGVFYFSVPISTHQRIEFNAHRIFSLPYILELITPIYEIIDFSFIGDDGNLIPHAELSKESINNSFNLSFGCGIFILKKK